MMSNSMAQQALRRMAARNASMFRPNRLIAPSALIIRPSSSISSQTNAPTVSHDASGSILANQRLNRPVSPHLSIYKPQVTWYLSALNRITGCVVSGGMYTFGFLYLIAPLFGWQLGSAALAAGFAKWPVALKFATKLTVALPFTFHSFNGLRHLAWDTGLGFKNSEVVKTGWTVVGISVVAALGLCFV